MHGRYSVLAHYLKVSLKNSRFLKIPKLHPQRESFFFVRKKQMKKTGCCGTIDRIIQIRAGNER